MTSDLREAWSRLCRVLEREAPRSAALIVPPSPSGAETYERLTGVTLDPQLVEWFSLHDGTAPQRWWGPTADVFPCRPLLSAQEAARRHLCLTTWDKVDTDMGGVLWESLPVALHAVSSSIEQGDPLVTIEGPTDWIPRVTDGELIWDLDGFDPGPM